MVVISYFISAIVKIFFSIIVFVINNFSDGFTDLQLTAFWNMFSEFDINGVTIYNAIYSYVVVPLACTILFTLLLFSLFKGMFSKDLAGDVEEPVPLLLRTGFGFLLIISSGKLFSTLNNAFNYFFGIIKDKIGMVGDVTGSAGKDMVNSDSLSSFLEDVDFGSNLGVDGKVLGSIFMCFIAWQMLMTLISIYMLYFERYAYYNIVLILAPLGFAFMGSASMMATTKQYIKTYLSSVLTLIVHFCMIYLYNLAVIYCLSQYNAVNVTEPLILSFIAIGIGKFALQVSSFLDKLGLTNGSGGLSAFGQAALGGATRAMAAPARFVGRAGASAVGNAVGNALGNPAQHPARSVSAGMRSIKNVLTGNGGKTMEDINRAGASINTGKDNGAVSGKLASGAAISADNIKANKEGKAIFGENMKMSGAKAGDMANALGAASGGKASMLRDAKTGQTFNLDGSGKERKNPIGVTSKGQSLDEAMAASGGAMNLEAVDANGKVVASGSISSDGSATLNTEGQEAAGICSGIIDNGGELSFNGAGTTASIGAVGKNGALFGENLNRNVAEGSKTTLTDQMLQRRFGSDMRTEKIKYWGDLGDGTMRARVTGVDRNGKRKTVWATFDPDGRIKVKHFMGGGAGTGNDAGISN